MVSGLGWPRARACPRSQADRVAKALWFSFSVRHLASTGKGWSDGGPTGLGAAEKASRHRLAASDRQHCCFPAAKRAHPIPQTSQDSLRHGATAATQQAVPSGEVIKCAGHRSAEPCGPMPAPTKAARRRLPWRRR
eukprot:scaffold10959_cov136-Isochrysis_galbana.AAC.4